MLGLLLALAPTPTPLSPPTPPAEIELSWEAPPGCPSGEEIIARYRELLHIDPTGQGVMVAEAVIKEEKRGVWRLELVTRMNEFTDVRKLRARRCADLGDAAAMLFAVALEPTLEAEMPTAEGVPEADEPDRSEFVDLEPETEASVVKTPPTVESQTEAAPPRKRPIYMSLTGGVEAGSVPGTTARASIGAGYVLSWARIEADLLWLAPRSLQGTFGPAVIQVAGAAARGCGVPGTGRWKFPVCVGFEAGATIARVGRIDGRRTVSGRWLGPLLRVGAVLQGERIGGLLAIEGAGPVLSAQIRVDDDTIFAPTRGSVRGILGMEIYFF